MRLKIRSHSKPLLISLSPNVTGDDLVLALKLILAPWKWKEYSKTESRESKTEKLEKEFKSYLAVKYAFAFNSGRSGIMALLNALNLEKGSEILIQGFTCNALVNPILWSGLKPVYVDINAKTLNLDPKDLERKITKKSRGVIVQHTFGLPAELTQIGKICQENNLILIEDCAHSLGARYQGKPVGTFGQAAFFSLGRDKIISSVYGGVVVTNDDKLARTIKVYQEKLNYPSWNWIAQQLCHPILTKLIIIPLYGLSGAGKWVLLFFQQAAVLSKAVQKKEKEGEKPAYFPQKMPEPLATLALNQFKKLDKFILHQRKIAQRYEKQFSKQVAQYPNIQTPAAQQERVYLRYSLLIKDSDTGKILAKARRQKIFLDDGWRKTAVTPPDTNQAKMGYVTGICPEAERVAKSIVNLPTHINVLPEDIDRITKLLKNLP